MPLLLEAMLAMLQPGDVGCYMQCLAEQVSSAGIMHAVMYCIHVLGCLSPTSNRRTCRKGCGLLGRVQHVCHFGQ